jgi:galactose mutarotase-like enzyme
VSSQTSPLLQLRSGDLAAEVDPLGAQLSALSDRSGHALLWSGDPSVWSGRAPLLFPIVGELAGGSYRLGTKSYELPRHGFARRSQFQIVESNAASAVLRLESDEQRFRQYPFHFRLDMRFALDGPVLSMTARINNLGDEPMPASFGYHPALRWPLPFGRPRSAHFIEFEEDEPAAIRRLDAQGLLTPEHHATPIRQRRLALDDALFENDVVIFDDIRSRSVTYGADDGLRIRVGFHDAPFLGLWTKPRAEFICIEPWHGIADPQGFRDDFREKPGVFIVPAGAGVAITITIGLQSR